MRFSAALFDLDGTLLDTIADLADAVNAMLVDLGQLELSRATIEGYVGKGTEYLVTRCMAHSGAEAGTDAPTRAEAKAPNDPAQGRTRHGLSLFAGHYRRLSGNKAVLYPGVLDGLRAFRAQGLKMAIVTNKPTEFTRPLLQSKGIVDFFDHIVCGDTCARKKPDPMPFLHACSQLKVAPVQALAVGDSINDALAARAAGITMLAVPYGYNGGQGVRTFQVDDIVTSIEGAAQWAAHHQNEPSPQP